MSQFVGVENINEFYGEHYLEAIAQSDVGKLVERWKAAPGGGELPSKRLANLHRDFFARREDLASERDPRRRLEALHAHAAAVLDALGYEVSPVLRDLAGGKLPLLASVSRPDGRPLLWALASLPTKGDDASPLLRPILREQVQRLAPPADREDANAPAGTIEELITAAFDLEEPPRFVLIVSESDVFLCERSKWAEQRMLRFDLAEILGRRDEPTLQLTAALLHRTSLAPDEGPAAIDDFDDNSHKHAFAVSEDLKYALRECIEALGNEAVQQLRARHEKIFTEDRAAELARECMRYMYRLLFLFYVEARPELGWAPLGADAWTKGYSLDRLRSFEQHEFDTEEERKGSYLHQCLSLLFKMVFEGAQPKAQQQLTGKPTSIHGVFELAPLKSHLFDPDRTPLLSRVEFPNHVLQKVIEKMSLSREGAKRRGRISYATLGISQLGAVYEALLSFRGFFAKEPLFELYPNGENPGPLDPAWFVTEAQLAEYADDEKFGKVPKKGEQPPGLKRYAPGTFIYRMSGRDRQKSASFYTPQSLTKATVEYTLQEVLFDEQGKEKLSADEILKLTVLEPAVGSAAFLNEAIDQLSEAYLQRKQRELGTRISHEQYAYEKQRVKMFIADRNVYGIDLNPIAIELAEVSLWLNTIHRGAYVPWFGTQLVRGNSLIGGRRDVWSKDQVVGDARAWLAGVPARVRVGKPRPEGSVWHFLLPDEGMAVYGEGTEGKPIKEEFKKQLAKIDRWRRDICSPLEEDEHQNLGDLSDAIDRLWKRHVSELREMRRRTTDPMAIYGQPAVEGQPTTTAQKDAILDQEMASQGVKASSPYRRLKLAMDYWCALWFWPIEKADQLPSREEMLSDLTLLLDSSLVHGRDATKAGETREMFATTRPQEEARKLVEELGFVDVPRLLEKRPRLNIANELAERHGFMHQELEFADLFDERDGFDVILGNPPWIRIEWNERDVLSDLDPAFALKTLEPNEIRGRRESVLRREENKEVWCREHELSAATQSFLAAHANFPELTGSKVNLYKCFLPRAWRNQRSSGAAGFLHPEGVYDEPTAGAFRRAALIRLRRHYQFLNEKGLFPEVHNQTRFSINVYSVERAGAKFVHIANLFHPSTIAESHRHSGEGPVPGIKDHHNNWTMRGHGSRIVEVGSEELGLFAELYDPPGTPPLEARLPALHSRSMVPTLRRFLTTPSLGRSECAHFASLHMNESYAVADGTILRATGFPDSVDDVVLSGPHFFVSAPFYKTPRRTCDSNKAYDVIDLTSLPEDYLPRTNFARACGRDEYNERTPRVSWNVGGRRPRITELYRVAVTAMIGPAGERTLQAALIPPGYGHIDNVNTYSFERLEDVVATTGMWSSLPVDFFVKTTGSGHFRPNQSRALPTAPSSIRGQLGARTLGLNCVTRPYARLWGEVARLDAGDGWTRTDARLAQGWFTLLTQPWSRESALRTDYARRQALVEVDTLVALGLDMEFEELLDLYRAQFPIMREYERDTWYDQRGRIVFTNSKGLSTIGLSRQRERGSSTPGWEEVKDMKSGTFDVVIEDDTMPGGPIQRTITYEAPFDRCDREADYAQAWAEFKRRGL